MHKSKNKKRFMYYAMETLYGQRSKAYYYAYEYNDSEYNDSPKISSEITAHNELNQ